MKWTSGSQAVLRNSRKTGSGIWHDIGIQHAIKGIVNRIAADNRGEADPKSRGQNTTVC